MINITKNIKISKKLNEQKIEQFINLLHALNHGMVSAHYLQDNKECIKTLKAYVMAYLKEEVFAEGLTRNVPAFSIVKAFLENFEYL